jgi:ribonuclease D
MTTRSATDTFEVVTTDSQVRDLVDRLARHPHVCFDTEFVSEHTYRSQLCLVQVAAPEMAGGG